MSDSACDGCSRRALLKGIGKGLGFVALAPAALSTLAACGAGGANIPTASSTTCTGGTCIDVSEAANTALATAGGALLIDTASDTIIVVRVSDSEVIALSAICTHAGCIVDWNASAARIDCNCHGSEFTQTGAVITGPAHRSLKQYTATLAGTVITVAA